MHKINDTRVNEIVYYLQDLHDTGKLSLKRFNYCNAYTGEPLVYCTPNGLEYTVYPIVSYRTVVGFACGYFVYEVGKYSRTTSKQFTQICNQIFNNIERVYVERTY